MSGLADSAPLAPVARRALPAGIVAVAAAITAAGLIVRWRTRIDLGAPLPPFLMSWSPVVRPTALAGVAVALAVIGIAPWAINRVRSSAAFAALVYAGTVAVGLAINAARRGTGGWSHVFDLSGHGSFEASREYLPALKWLDSGVGRYVGSYPKLLHYLPTHTKGNPPGPLVVMHLLSITTPGRLAAACVAVGALCAPLAYALGRELGSAEATIRTSAGGSSGGVPPTGEHRGRVAAVLTMLSPAVVLFGVTSVDYAFAALGTLGAWLLVSRTPAARAAGCVAVAVASFFSWVLLAIPVWAVLVTWRRDGPRAAALTAAGAAAAIVALTLILAAVWGYDPVEILRTASRIYGGGAAAQRPYAFWVFGSPAAWLALLGPAIAWPALRALARGEPAALALALVVLVSTVAGFTKAETERIWLPYVPLACVAAASLPVRRLRLTLGLLALQAVAIELLFGTVW